MIKKLLKIKSIKVFLCFIENIIKSISIKLWKVLENRLYNPYNFGKKSIEYSKWLYEKILKYTKKYNFNLEGKKFLELWPGGFLWLWAYLKKEWISKYFVIDEIKHFDKLDKKTISLYEKIDPSFLKNNFFDKDFVNILEYWKNWIPLEDNSIDLCFSQSVYEHVKNPEESIKDLARITKTWWIHIHHIDFKDHIIDRESLFFLKIPKKIFDLLFYNSWAWVNRKRSSDFETYFKNAWFEILDIVTISEHNNVLIRKYKKLLKKYSENDLKKWWATFIIKK